MLKPVYNLTPPRCMQPVCAVLHGEHIFSPVMLLNSSRQKKKKNDGPSCAICFWHRSDSLSATSHAPNYRWISSQLNKTCCLVTAEGVCEHFLFFLKKKESIRRGTLWGNMHWSLLLEIIYLFHHYLIRPVN